MAITKEQAEEFLRQDIATTENIVDAECMNLRQCQFDALVSFVFNVGGGNFRKSMTTQLWTNFCGGYMRKALPCQDSRSADLWK